MKMNINFCLKCHQIVKDKDIEGVMLDLSTRKFITGQGTELGFHDSDCQGLIIEISQELVNKIQEAYENAIT